MSRDPAVDFLLDFNGEKLEQENGYWMKIEARLVDVSSTVPHGLRYSLTLHDCSKRRILGYDNAHASCWCDAARAHACSLVRIVSHDVVYEDFAGAGV